MKAAISILLVGLVASCTSTHDEEAARTAVLATLDSWNRGWVEGDASVAVEDYSEDADWTNAFGDRFQGREALREGLEFIFGLGFVMAGTSSDNEFSDVTFLAPDVALLRSKLVRTGQQMSNGSQMQDRHIHHLRVLQRRDGEWKIVSHLISQAQEKR
ncbi:MAG: SgcJ/EcaC family oxidoreductase [Gemmatimonadales bacterium]|nr:SgcJ/EcaC family oxidoreductase [Gemmatimonadales bacterium]